MSAESKSLINRLRGTYPVGPIMESGEPEFGYRDMFGPNVTAPGIDLEAAAHIEKLEGELAALRQARIGAESVAPPAILFNTHAVYSAMDVKGHSRTSTENVGDVLDAVVKILNQQ